MKRWVKISIHTFVLLTFALTILGRAYVLTSYYNDSILKNLIDSLLQGMWNIAIFYTAYKLYIPQYLITKEFKKFFLLGLSIMIGFTLIFNLGAQAIKELFDVRFHSFVKGWWTGIAFLS